MIYLSISYCGGVGKSTTLSNAVKPYHPTAKFFSIESINEGVNELGIDAEKLPGNRYKELFSKILLEDDAIVDVGSSNVESFMDGLARYEDSHLEFDYFIVPVIPGVKPQQETASTLLALQNHGVDPSKIKVVFNRVQNSVETEFKLLLGFFKNNPEFSYNPECAIMENELFDMLSIKKMSIDDILEDTTDYRSLIRDPDSKLDKKQRKQYIDALVARSLAKTVKKNLDHVYNALFN